MGLGNDNLPKLLNTILNSFMDLCGCDGGSIFTVRETEEGRQLAFAAMVTRSMKLQSVPEHLSRLCFKFDDSSLVGRTATTKTSFRISYADQQRERVATDRVDKALHYVTRNILSAPLVTPRGDLVGVVQLLNKNPYGDVREPEFDERDERLFSIVAGQAALAIENSLLLEEQERLLEGFVNACVTAIEARDPTTSGHSTRVADYSLALADALNRNRAGPLRELKFNAAQQREIRYAAMLHDIGKISVKETVLMKEKKLFPWELELIRMRLKLMRANLRLRGENLEKIDFAWKAISEANQPTVLPAEVSAAIQELQALEVTLDDGERLSVLTRDEGFKLAVVKGSLTSGERMEIERHVSHTYEILKMVPWSRGLELVPTIAYRHHEKLDGSGYPCKVKQPEIPVQSRMLTICDIYDALTADDRPYKKAVPVDKALDILKMEVGTGKLDPNLFQVFIDARVYEIGAPARKREEGRMSKKDPGQGVKIDGMGAAAELLAGLDPEHRKRLLGQVAARDPAVADKLERRLFGFEDLRRLSDHDLQLVLREAPHSKIIVALRRATEELQESVYRNVTSRTGEMLREEVRSQGPKRVSDIQAAQADILKIALRLEAEGKIRLKGLP